MTYSESAAVATHGFARHYTRWHNITKLSVTHGQYRIEQGLMSHQTLRVKWPNQRCQSTERR